MPWEIKKENNRFCVHKKMMDKMMDETRVACHDTMEEAQRHMRALYANEKSLDTDNTLAFYGGAVKALGGGRIAGYGVLFTTAADPDLQDEAFVKGVDLELEIGDKRTIYYRHGTHPIIQNRKLGKATLKQIDDAGAFFEGELNVRDDYERYIYKLAELGKLGWSTGAVSHLVRKEMTEYNGRKVSLIKEWPVGEISLTPCPVEARTSAFPIKSLEAEADLLDDFIKSEEQEEEVSFDIAGTPALKAFCEAVAPNSSIKDGSQRSKSAANAAKEFIAYARTLGEAYDSYTSRLVKRTENRFLKEGRELDSSTVMQVESAIADMERIEPAMQSIKEVWLGIRKITEMSKAEQKAMDEKARLAVWNYYRISGNLPEEFHDGRSTS